MLSLLFTIACNEKPSTTDTNKKIPIIQHATSGSGGNGCSAKSTLQLILNAFSGSTENSCEVTNCPEGTAAYCTAGFWSATCYCRPINQQPGQPSYQMPSPSVSDLQIASDFRDWLLLYESIRMNVLGGILDSDIIALNNNDQEDFDFYEYQFHLLYEDLTIQEKTDIETWASNYEF